MLKRERAEDNAYVGSFPILIKITLQVYKTQFPIGDNHLNNHTKNVLAMLLQSCKHKKTRNSYRMYVGCWADFLYYTLVTGERRFVILDMGCTKELF